MPPTRENGEIIIIWGIIVVPSECAIVYDISRPVAISDDDPG